MISNTSVGFSLANSGEIRGCDTNTVFINSVSSRLICYPLIQLYKSSYRLVSWSLDFVVSWSVGHWTLWISDLIYLPTYLPTCTNESIDGIDSSDSSDSSDSKGSSDSRYQQFCFTLKKSPKEEKSKKEKQVKNNLTKHRFHKKSLHFFFFLHFFYLWKTTFSPR